MRVARRWRSSASPSSAPHSASRPWRRSGSSGTLSSCGTGSPGCGRRSRRVRSPPWRARLGRRGHHPRRARLTVEAAGWVDVQVAAVAGKVGPAQLDRLVAEAIKRYDLAGARIRLPIRRTATSPSTPATPPCTPRTCTTPAPCGSRPSSTSPTPSTSTGCWPTAPPPSRRWDRACPSTPAVPPRSATSPGRRPRSTSTPKATAARERQRWAARRTRGRAPRPLRRHHRRPDHRLRSHRSVGGRAAAGAARAGEGLVRRHSDQGHRQARHRPQRRARGPPLPGPRPDPRAGPPSRPHLRVPLVQQTRPEVRRRPHRRVRPRRRRRGRAQPGPDHDLEPGCICAGSTTGSRPSPPGTTG